jgi:Tfp pilus assembly protein PilO
MNNRVSTNQNYKDKIALSALIFLLAAAGLFCLIIIPATESIKRIKLDTEIQVARVEKDYQTGKWLKERAENLKIIEPQLSELDKIFIKKDNSTDFITTLEKTAEKNSVTIEPITNSTFGAENKLEEGNYSQIPMQTKTRGYFSNQIGYLSNLEALNYYLNIKTLEISTVNDDKAPSGEINKNLDMHIITDTYWQN